MLFRLSVKLDGSARRFVLQDGENLLGSHAGCDVHLPHPTVSRHHAVLVLTDSGIQVADLGSANGTLVNGEPVRSAPIGVELGDDLVFGTVSAVIESMHEDDLKKAGRPDRPDDGDRPENPEPIAEPADARTTASIHPVQVFALGHLPRLLAALADGSTGAQSVVELGVALFGSLQCQALEIRRCPGGGVVFSAGAALDGYEEKVGDDHLEIVATVDTADRARLYRPLLEAGLHIARLAYSDTTGGAKVTTARTEAGRQPIGVPSVDPVVKEHFAAAERVARGHVHVLVLGESGTGKEVMARFVHDASPRAEAPFLAVNCAALPSDLLESELFGIEKGVATGVDARPGRFELAHGGTLFLDEIGDMALEVQAKILRVIEEATVYRVGGRDPRPADVRLVSATNRKLESMLRQQGFRADLYHRIAGWEVRLPPLRDRSADVPNLVTHFIDEQSRLLGIMPPAISRAALRALVRYSWPGNIRELKQEIARAVLFVDEGELLDSGCLSPRVAEAAQAPEGGLKAFLEKAEESEINRVLSEHDGHVASAAEALQVPVSTLYRKIKARDE